MNRRQFLRAGAAGGLAALAGCTGLFETRSARSTRTPAGGSLPDGVYVPTHVDGMEMVGMATDGDYKFGITYTVPHRFWTMTVDEKSEHPIEESHDLHLMATVWEPETGTVVPTTGVSVEILKDGDPVSQESIYPMLSQRMGFHYGANFGLDGEGAYTAEVTVSPVSDVRTTGEFAGRFDERAAGAAEFEFREATMEAIAYRRLNDYGEAGAVKPMNMDMVPVSSLPAPEDLPGTVRGQAKTGDGVMVVTTLDEASLVDAPEKQYLAVSARTPYNGLVLPMMGLEATLERDGETAFEGTLERTLDSDLNYHYGAAVDSVESGDSLTLSVSTPPQVGRHLGYERAFVEMPDVTMTL